MNMDKTGKGKPEKGAFLKRKHLNNDNYEKGLDRKRKNPKMKKQ